MKSLRMSTMAMIRAIIVLLICCPIPMPNALDSLGLPRSSPVCRGPAYLLPIQTHRVWDTRRALVKLDKIFDLLNDALPLIKKSLNNLESKISNITNTPKVELSSNEGPIIDLSQYNIGQGHGGKAVILTANASEWLESCRMTFSPSADTSPLDVLPGGPLVLERDESIPEILDILAKLGVSEQPIHAEISSQGAVNPLTGGLLAKHLLVPTDMGQYVQDTLIYLDVKARKYRFTKSAQISVRGLCIVSPQELEKTDPQRVISTLRTTYNRMRDVRLKIVQINSMLEVPLTAERVSITQTYDIIPPPALYKLLHNLRVTAELLNYEDISQEEIGIFDRTSAMAAQLLGSYKIIDDYMSFPLASAPGAETTLFRPELAPDESHHYIGTMKYYNQSTYTQYLIYPQGFLAQNGEMMKVTTKYLSVINNAIPFTSSILIDRYLCDADLSGAEICDVHRPVDASFACGLALTQGKTWDECPQESVFEPMFFQSSLCDPNDQSVQISTPLDIYLYITCNHSPPTKVGYFQFGTHKVSGMSPTQSECTFAWSMDDDTNDLHSGPLFSSTSIKQNAIAYSDTDFGDAHGDDEEELEEWEIVIITLTSLCSTGCFAFIAKFCYDNMKCLKHKRRSDPNNNLPSRILAQQQNEAITRSHPANVIFDNPIPRSAQVSHITGVNEMRLSPAASSVMPGTDRGAPRPRVPVSRPPQDATETSLYVVGQEIMAWRPVDHHLSSEDRRVIRRMAMLDPSRGIRFQDLPRPARLSLQ